MLRCSGVIGIVGEIVELRLLHGGEKGRGKGGENTGGECIFISIYICFGAVLLARSKSSPRSKIKMRGRDRYRKTRKGRGRGENAVAYCVRNCEFSTEYCGLVWSPAEPEWFVKPGRSLHTEPGLCLFVKIVQVACIVTFISWMCDIHES